jgi:CHAT domain-containing protein/Tfp pilus assembly protein PilF
LRILKAEVLLAQGKPKDAVSLLDARPPRRPEFEELSIRRVLYLGHARVWLAEYAQAAPLFDEAARAAAAGGFDLLSAEIELRRGAMLVRQDDREGADRAFRTAREIAARKHDVYLEASAVGNLGYSLLSLARFDEAVPYLDRAATLSGKIGARLMLATSLGNLGRCFYGLGDFDRAMPLQIKAVAASEEMGDQVRQQIWLGNLGDTYQSLGDLRSAASCYQRALAISRRIGERFSTAFWLHSLADMQLESGDIASASKTSDESLALSLEIGAPVLKTQAMLTRAQIQMVNGQYEEAEKGFREVVASTSLENKHLAWLAQMGLGRLYAKQQRWREAAAEFRRAVENVESARAKLPRDQWQITFQAGSIGTYRDYVEFLMDRGRAEEALGIAEFARARVLAQKLGLKQTLEGPVPASRFREAARVHRAALVSYWLAPHRSFVWIVTADKVRSFTLPGDSEIKPLIESYQAAIQGLRDPLETGNPAGRRLSEILLQPIRNAVPRASRLILVPDGPLHEFNLETLPVDTHYWLEDVSIAIAPSLAVLAPRAGPSAPARKSLLLIGNSRPPGSDYPPLPAVEKELASIQARLSGWEQKVFTGPAAQPSVYGEAAPSRFSIIHFSAHAAANRQNPLESAVILSPKGESYKLYARDIAAIPLQAGLVTISACRGAGSRTYSGEGLVGFAWAFLQAGAGNVIAGLWEVNDASTAALMDNLYAQLASGQPPATALRNAKLALIRSGGAWKKPYYWAAFEDLSRAFAL